MRGAVQLRFHGHDLRARLLELHSNVAAEGSTRTIDHVLRTQGAFHETLEITQGWTPWFETAFYVFTSLQPDTTWEWAGDHIRPRVRVPEKKRPVSAPRRRISCRASREASVAASEASIACSSFFISGSTCRSRRIGRSIS